MKKEDKEHIILRWQLMGDISSGKFNTENIGSCCGGVCGKQ